MKKIKDRIVQLINSIKTLVKSFVQVVMYISAAVSFGYAIWFAVKNNNNGKSIPVNLVAGFIHGIGKLFVSAAEVLPEK